MKRSIIILSALIWVFTCFAQAPQQMNYQAAIRGIDNKPISETAVGMKISIIQTSPTGNVIYAEKQNPTTDVNGLVSFEIGAGTVESGSFAAIDWAAGPYFIQTETDPAGGTNYTINGISQLMSVPYALYAETVGAVTETDPDFNASVAAEITANDTTNWNTAYAWGNHATQGYMKLQAAQNGALLTYDGSNWVSKKLVLSTAATGYNQAVNNMQPFLALNYCIALNGIFPSRSGYDPFVGEIELYAFNFAPSGYTQCNGAILAINTDMALFALIGTTFGGNGTTTFAVPDLRGRVPIHYGQGAGLSNRAMGEGGGAESVTLTIGNLPSHTHTISIVYE